MLNFQQISKAFELIALIQEDQSVVKSTHFHGDWLKHLLEHVDYSLED